MASDRAPCGSCGGLGVVHAPGGPLADGTRAPTMLCKPCSGTGRLLTATAEALLRAELADATARAETIETATHTGPECAPCTPEEASEVERARDTQDGSEAR